MNAPFLENQAQLSASSRVSSTIRRMRLVFLLLVVAFLAACAGGPPPPPPPQDPAQAKAEAKAREDFAKTLPKPPER